MLVLRDTGLVSHCLHPSLTLVVVKRATQYTVDNKQIDIAIIVEIPESGINAGRRPGREKGLVCNIGESVVGVVAMDLDFTIGNVNFVQISVMVIINK